MAVGGEWSNTGERWIRLSRRRNKFDRRLLFMYLTARGPVGEESDGRSACHFPHSVDPGNPNLDNLKYL